MFPVVWPDAHALTRLEDCILPGLEDGGHRTWQDQASNQELAEVVGITRVALLPMVVGMLGGGERLRSQDGPGIPATL